MAAGGCVAAHCGSGSGSGSGSRGMQGPSRCGVSVRCSAAWAELSFCLGGLVVVELQCHGDTRRCRRSCGGAVWSTTTRCTVTANRHGFPFRRLHHTSRTTVLWPRDNKGVKHRLETQLPPTAQIPSIGNSASAENAGTAVL